MEKQKQSYQEVSKIMEQDIKRLKKRGLDSLDNFDVQSYFFKRKQRYPEKYQRLDFNTNGHKPYSEDVDQIIRDFLIIGILKTSYYHIE